MTAALGVASLLLLGAAPVLEKPEKYATDRAGVVPAERLVALNDSLAAFERETSNQLVVYVDRRLPEDTTLEELASETFRRWGIGQKDKANGLLFLVFVDDRAMRVEVGYGLEGVIPDARARRITSEVVKPFFKKGDFAGGIEAGAQALMAAARVEGHAGTGRTVAETPRPPPPLAPWALGTTFGTGLVPLVIGLARRRKTGRRLSSILATACAAAAVAAFGAAAVTGHPTLWVLGASLLAATVVLGIVNAIAAGASGRTARPTDSPRSSAASTGSDSSHTSSSPSDSSSSSSDSSSSSSDFSGGGGDSGGGGSSDNW
jgi:uncharacterized protein